MKGIMGGKTVNFPEIYDDEDDVYYVSFNTGEPSYSEEVDDILVMERGIFTNMPTGFRILNFKEHKVEAVEVSIKNVQKTFHEMKKDVEKDIREREEQFENTLQKVFA